MSNKPIPVEELRGVYVALATPMLTNLELDEDGKPIQGLNKIDYDKLEMHVENIVADGVGILVAGTTGQSATLGQQEHVGYVEKVYEMIGGRAPLIIGAGSNATSEAIARMRDIEKAIGASTFLHVTGYYNNPTQKGLNKHFTAVADSTLQSESNIIIYNVPGRTSNEIQPATIEDLAKHSRIVGLKQASGDMEQARRMYELTKDQQFVCLSGEDHLTIDMMENGYRGVISATANVSWRYMKEMIDAYNNGDLTKARKMQARLNVLVKQGIFAQGTKNPEAIAYIMGSDMRLPMIVPEGEIAQGIEGVLDQNPELVDLDVAKYRALPADR